jgi:soluble lytic murein transglycosylase
MRSASYTSYTLKHTAKKAWGRLSRRDWLMLLAGFIIALLIVKVISVIENGRAQIPYQSAGVSAPWVPSTVKYWDKTINEMGKRYNVDPNLIAIIMTMESGGDASAKSEDNAVGLMQITPPAAKDIASKYLKTPVTKYNLYNPTTNIEFGTAYLAWLRDYFGTAQQGPSWNATVELVAAGYNGGPGAAGSLEAGQGLTNDQTIIYSRDAFNMWRERNAKDSPTFDRWKERGGTLLIDAAKTHNQ